ncbi:MAG: aminotransferase class I/II-fold pyridoxal phosphate-dependent enzyme [Alphaproteobacteria bacterium]|nr:aminotransferase class I/II-fold pyridoxal phosphate-dependent enzyme [Alphaproteobacteria bacterium]
MDDFPRDGAFSAPHVKARQSMLDLARGLASKAAKPIIPIAKVADSSSKTNFATLPAYKELRRHRAVADVMQVANPFFKTHEGRSGATCVIDGRTYDNFISYDYLGLNGAPEVNAAATAAIVHYGTSVSASRPTAGDRPLHRDLERAIAANYETDDALCFVSGHGTNVSVIGELLDKGDLIVFDSLCHNSIVLGTRLAGASRRSFPHNDIAALDALLRDCRHQFNRVLIVVEGLYSMDGDVARLPELIEIKHRHAAWLMVDEAHSMGVLGQTGRGVFEHFDTSPKDVDIWMGTLSKTLSACGGYIAGCQALIDNLKFNASAFMFSVGMSPPVAAAALAALEKMHAEPERVERLRENGRTFVRAFTDAGLDIGNSAGHAIGVAMVGDSMRAAKLAERLFERGISTIPVTYPAVAMRSARLRFFLTSEHTADQIENAARVLRQEFDTLSKDKFGLATAAAAINYMTS